MNKKLALAGVATAGAFAAKAESAVSADAGLKTCLDTIGELITANMPNILLAVGAVIAAGGVLWLIKLGIGALKSTAGKVTK